MILAGGRATRYGGRPKGLERVGGQRVIDRVAAALGPVTDSLLLVANDPDAGGWLEGVPAAADVLPDLGSLGGIHSALVHAAGPVLVVAWDMPFASTDLLRALRALGESADVAVPESGSRRGVEPLCAWYSPACLAPIAKRLVEGDLRVVSFFDDVRVARLSAETVATFGDPALLFMNINTPEDLATAEIHASAPHSRRP
ncbi:MAG: molybdenum cofactor guanylyltransferase [Gemmatimonadota bacterium]